MYPDLSYLAHALFGTEPDNWLSIFKTFGFMLAMAFLASAVTFYHELKRKAKAGAYVPTRTTVTEGVAASPVEIAVNALVGLIIGGKGGYGFQHFAEFRGDPASVILSGKMDWLTALIGAVLLGGFTWWDTNRRRLATPVTREVSIWPHDRISEMTVWAAVGGILGAKFFDVFDNWEEFLRAPARVLLSGGGLAFFGGLIMGFIAVVSYMVRQKIPFLPTADAVAPALTAGYGVGRIGCQLSGDGDWGLVSGPKPGALSWLPDWMWGFTYPHNVLKDPDTAPVPSVPIEGCHWEYCLQLSQPVYPTPFYEVVMMIGVFAILWSLRKRVHVPGLLFFIYIGLIAIERFLIEKIRVNVHHDVLGIQMSQAEIIAVSLFVIAVAGGIWSWQRAKKLQATAQ